MVRVKKLGKDMRAGFWELGLKKRVGFFCGDIKRHHISMI
jgi:hypothetical protein